jgi:hypothetical protein
MADVWVLIRRIRHGVMQSSAAKSLSMLGMGAGGRESANRGLRIQGKAVMQLRAALPIEVDSQGSVG